MTMTDIESLIEPNVIPHEKTITAFLRELITKGVANETDMNTHMQHLRKKYHLQPSKRMFRTVYQRHGLKFPPLTPFLSKYMINKEMRSRSGVLVSTIVLRPDKFSCPKNCAYCPTETDRDGNLTQPKSYLSSEPAMLRALQYKFDVKGQLHDRIESYRHTGNIGLVTGEVSYKLEMILSGGTWESYPSEYREQVMVEIYWAANTYDHPRPMLTLEEEILINETAMFRIIGLTIETRPDFVTSTSIRQYQRWGVTRVQLGIQHYDDNVLDFINRDCHTSDAILAIRLLKQNGFKVVCHLMPDLPSSSPALDRWMFKEARTNPDVQFDDVKIYPTAICKSDNPDIIVTTDIAKWYEEGSYVPYSETHFNVFIQILKEYKQAIQPWVRIQRLVRDIPDSSIEAGYNKKSNLRQMIQDEMKKEGTTCQCIRCMEIDEKGDDGTIQPRLVVRSYPASKGTEYFISYEVYEEKWDPWYEGFKVYQWFYQFITQTPLYWHGQSGVRKAIIGFCRLRIDPNPGGDLTPEINNCGLIREVHVYGSSIGIHGTGNSSQHKGYGQKLVKVAETIIRHQSEYTKSAVIAGVGTREYYKNKCGYHKEGTYMVREVVKTKPSMYWQKVMAVCLVSILLYSIL